MKQCIINSLEKRLATEISSKNPLKYLKEIDLNICINDIISCLYLYTRPKRKAKSQLIYFSEIVCALGNAVRCKYKLKRNSSLSAKTGAFILYTFELLGLITVYMTKGNGGHGTYCIKILNDEAIIKLWCSLPLHEITKIPSITQYPDWTSVCNNGNTLIKTGNLSHLKHLTKDTHPILFDCVNKAQSIGWIIDNEILELEKTAFKLETQAFSDIWTSARDAKRTKIRETLTIFDIADRFLNTTFYHLYWFDFRGRKYDNTAYLKEQGNDVAKGILRLSNGAPITKKGFQWLMVSLASLYGGSCDRDDKRKTDKIKIKERYDWSIKNEEKLLSYAIDPLNNTEWMEADKPWQFISACIELRRFREAQKDINDYSFITNIVLYLDGSNNGSQHLAALTRDEVIAKYVNLIPQEYPGDLYAYVADHVWSQIAEELKEYDKDLINDCNEYIKTLISIKKEVKNTEYNTLEWKSIVSKLTTFKNKNRDLQTLSAPVFWSLITDAKERRKICKRGTMTIPYGGTAYGLGEQVIKDSKKHGIELLLYLEHSWGAYMGRHIYNDCYKCIKRPMQLLKIFSDAGNIADKESRFLSWNVPITNFPVTQYYVQGTIKKVWIQYGPQNGIKKSNHYYENTYQINICFIEEPVKSKGKQALGASPNIIHSLDAAHLALTVHRATFPVITVHDSYGSLPTYTHELFKLVRETFVELYDKNPLDDILIDIGKSNIKIDYGNLNIRDILKSQYSFL
jgi:hypothetical protein